MILVALAGFMPPFACGLYAQDYIAPEVTVSKERVKVDGRIFYSHIVLEKQTLFSISKAYGVTVEDIYATNPALKENGLKKNAIILIPVTDRQEESKDDKVSQKDERTALKEEKALQKEAAKKEAQEEKKAKALEKKRNDYFTHTVKWYEDLNVISEKYGVSVDIIMKFNGLTGRKLTNRQKLRIPTNPEAYMAGLPEHPSDTGAASSAPSSPAKPEDQAAEPSEKSVQTSPVYYPITKINAVLLLPFNTQGEKHSESSMDFYSGVLLASKDLGDKGLNIDLSVYDVGGGVLPITTERLAKSDVIIGPVSKNDISGLFAKAPQSSYIISPLDHRAEQLAEIHSNFIQVPTSSMSQYEDIVKWIKEEKDVRDSVIVIYEKAVKDTEDLAGFKQIISGSGIRYSSFSYSILEGRNILESLAGKMTSEGNNRVIVASDSEAFVNDVIRNLNLMIHNRYKVTLYGVSKIRSFETIDVENLHNAEFHSSLSYYIDYDDPRVRDFILKYRALYNTEPTPFAFQGYDIMYYFCSMCSKYGSLWKERIENIGMPMLQSDFRFARAIKADTENASGLISEGGLVNKATRRIVYMPDYKVRVIR